MYSQQDDNPLNNIVPYHMVFADSLRSVYNAILMSKEDSFAKDRSLIDKARTIMILNFLYADSILLGFMESKGKVRVKSKSGKGYIYEVYDIDKLKTLDIFDLWYAMGDKQMMAGLVPVQGEEKHGLKSALVRRGSL